MSRWMPCFIFLKGRRVQTCSTIDPNLSRDNFYNLRHCNSFILFSMQNCSKMPRIPFAWNFETALIWFLDCFLSCIFSLGKPLRYGWKEKKTKKPKKIFAGESRGGKKGWRKERNSPAWVWVECMPHCPPNKWPGKICGLWKYFSYMYVFFLLLSRSARALKKADVMH